MSDTEFEVPATGQLPHEPEIEQGERPLSAREQMMADIVAKRTRALEAEMEQNEVLTQDARDAGFAHPDEMDEPAADPEPAPRQRAARSDAQQPEPQQLAIQQPQLFTVPINGQNFQVTQEQLIQLAQTGMIANETINQFRQQQNAPPPVYTPPVERQPEFDETRIREAVKRLQYGTEDDAFTGMRDLISHAVQNAPRGPQINPDAIINRAVNEAMAKQQLARDTDTIRQEFPEIFSNPIRADAAARQVASLRQELQMMGRQASDLEVYREAGNRVRQAFGTVTAPEPESQRVGGIVVRPRDNVAARKRDAPRQTSSVIDRRAAPPPQERAPSPSDVIEKMRLARGQTPMRG